MADDIHYYGEPGGRPPFPYVVYGMLIPVFIFVLYRFAGGIFVYLSDTYDFFVYDIIKDFAQVFFIFIPVILFAGMTPMPVQKLLRFDRLPDTKIFFISILGLLPLIIFCGSYSILQEYLVPDFLMPYYLKNKDFIEKVYTEMISDYGRNSLYHAIIIAAVVPGICEEVLFRGLMQKSLEQRMTPLKAILITGTVFGIYHLNPINLIPLIAIGIYLGIAAYYSGSLYTPIILHFLNNLFSVFGMYHKEIENLENQSAEFPIHIIMFMMAGSFALLLLIVFSIIRSHKLKSGI